MGTLFEWRFWLVFDLEKSLMIFSLGKTRPPSTALQSLSQKIHFEFSRFFWAQNELRWSKRLLASCNLSKPLFAEFCDFVSFLHDLEQSFSFRNDLEKRKCNCWLFSEDVDTSKQAFYWESNCFNRFQLIPELFSLIVSEIANAICKVSSLSATPRVTISI